MKDKSTSVLRKQNWRWLYPVLLLASIAGIAIPVKAYVQGYAQFSLRPIQILPTVAVTFFAVLAVGAGIGLLILNWRRVKREYWFVVIGAIVALVFFICVRNKASEPALLCTGLLMGLLIRSWEQGLLVRKWESKYKYLIFGMALVAGIVTFTQNKYPLLTVFVWGAVLGMMLNQRISPIEVYTDVVFGLALAIGVQVLLCNTGLETLSNSQPNWNNQSTGAVLSLHLWGLCLILPAVLRLIDVQVLRQVKRWGSVVLTTASVIAVVVFLAKADLSPIRVVTKDDEFVLSEEENVVVFLVDSLDARYAEDYVLAEDMRPKDEEEAETGKLANADLFGKWFESISMATQTQEEEKYTLDEELSHALLDDFTYFDNVVSGAWTSAISIPTLLTGERFAVNPNRDPKYNWEMYSQDLERYYEEAYAKSTLFSDLIENGYSVRFYSNADLVKGMDVGQIDNVRTDMAFRQKSFDTSLKNMFKLMAYYAMPYQAKRPFWISSNDIASNTEMATPNVQRYGVWDPSFYQDYLKEGLKTVEGRKSFVVYHLRGACAPYRMDEACNAVEEANTSLDRQVVGVFRMIGEYVEEMKQKGVYDNSTIVIAGTNGDLELGQNPAVFIKRRHEKRHFKVDSRPLTFANLRASLVKGIVEKPFRKYGYNMFNQPADKAPVLREHVAEQGKWKQLYSEDGPWWRTFMIMDEARGQEHILKTVESEPYPYTLDEWIPLCGYDDMTGKFPFTGLSGDEGEYRWTVGQDLTMSFALEEPRDNVLFRMDYVGTINGAQRLLGYVNNRPIYDAVASGASSIQFIIPLEYAPDGIYNIVLKLPDAVSPRDMGISEDGRQLGLQVTGCALCADLENYFYTCALNQWVPLSEDDVEGLPVTGLSGNEGGYRWTQGNRVWMALKLAGPAKDVTYELDCWGTLNGSQRVQIFANDHLIFDDDVSGASTIHCTIPKVYAPNGLYNMLITLPDAVSPAEIGINDDARKLALQLTGFRLAEVQSN